MITLKGVSAGYGGKEVLRDISLSVQPGELVALVGPNGSGKSTLIKIMAGQMLPLGGEAKLDGKDIKSYSPRQRSLRVSYFPQNRPTPDMDVRTLVSHGRFPRLGMGRVMGKDDTAAVEEAIAQTGLAGFEYRLLANLSGGERQRAYLAMHMAQQAEILLLDEPASFLDIRHQLEVMDILRRLNRQGRTVVFAAHDLPLAFSYAKRILLLRGGVLAGDCGPETMAAGNSVPDAFGVKLKHQEGGCLFRYALAKAEDEV